MNHLCRSITLCAVFALAIALPALAQTAPAGSYQLTCKDISVTGTTLNATCSWQGSYGAPTSLNFASGCVGDIANVHGTLACTGANGSFALTCRNAQVVGRTLSAQCKNKQGQYVNTTLQNFTGFDHNISNCGGKLQNTACQ
jgi:hypothetical protein